MAGGLEEGRVGVPINADLWVRPGGAAHHWSPGGPGAPYCITYISYI